MSRTTRGDSRIRAIDERLARLRAARSRLVARATSTERKRDTRRKILVGATILAAVEHGGVPALGTTRELLDWLDARLTRSHDRGVFDLARRANNSSTSAE
jgi:hypothetical protein